MHFDSQTVKNSFIIATFGALSTFLIVAALFVWDLHKTSPRVNVLLDQAQVTSEKLNATLAQAQTTVKKVDGTLEQVQRTSKLVADYAEEQITRLRDPKQQKSIDAAIQAAAVFNASGRLLNTQVIPRFMEVLDSTNESVQSLNAMIQNTDKHTNEALAQLTSLLAEIQEQTHIIGGDAHALLSNPGYREAVETLLATLKHIESIANSGDTAMKSAPHIAAEFDKAVTAATKVRWYMLAFRMLAYGATAAALIF